MRGHLLSRPSRCSTSCLHSGVRGPANPLQAHDLAPGFEVTVFSIVPAAPLLLVAAGSVVFKEPGRASAKCKSARRPAAQWLFLFWQIVAASITLALSWTLLQLQHIPSGVAAIGYAVGGAASVVLTVLNCFAYDRPSSYASAYWLAQAILQAASLRMRSSAVLINEADLVKALDAGDLAGAIMDVFEVEHIAGKTVQSDKNAAANHRQELRDNLARR
ncbi:hypothetical protein BDZ88DRAFT_454577 [Geranomyces variabilis]|nr:hypothetical protein BDZ88DRAFT_454577 [Geranomyces variabilis]KAJ3133196.1 hypothetical protein HDU90_006351 [Geranomyces variabilis]